MSPELHQRVRRLFEDALEKPEGERAAFLDAACGSEREVREAVDRLLAAHRDSGGFLASQKGKPAERRMGRYIVRREIGRGAMGVVYEGIDPLIGRSVAIKVIHPDSLAEPGKINQVREQLFREAHSAGRLLHPGIVVVFDVGEEGDTAYIAMELVDGRSLLDLLVSNRLPPVRFTVDLLRQAAAALDYAHQNGIVHRDIKPANIMLHKGNAVKIADFGVAKINSLSFRTATGMILGTPTYMSPEQIEMHPLDGRSDQFSLAVVAYEMLTGSRPFEADSLATLAHLIAYAERPSARLANPALTEAADLVLRRALAKRPEERFPTCAEFVTALSDGLWQAPSAPAQSSRLPLSATMVGEPLPASSRLEDTTRRTAPLVPEPPRAAPPPVAPPQAPGPPAGPPVPAPPRKKGPAVAVLAGFLAVAAIFGGGIWVYRNLPQLRSRVTQVSKGAASGGPGAGAAIPAPPPTIMRFNASSESIQAGSTALLHWQVLDATDVRIDPQVGAVAAADAIEVKPPQSTTYTLTAKGPGGQKTASLSVAVNRPAPEPSKTDKAAKLYQQALADRKAGLTEKATDDLRQAAQLDDVRSMLELADSLSDSGDDGEVKEAIGWYRKGAELGDATAMLDLGALYELGDKVTTDYELAAFWYRQGSEKGNAAATYNLGRLYESGHGVTKDLAKARQLYQRASDRGNPEAHIRLEQLSGK